MRRCFSIWNSERTFTFRGASHEMRMNSYECDTCRTRILIKSYELPWLEHPLCKAGTANEVLGAKE